MTRRIAVLIFERFQLLDAAGPIAAFEMAARFAVPKAYELKVVAAARGLVASSSGVSMHAEAMRNAAKLDTLLVAGGRGAEAAAACPRTRAFVKAHFATARRVCSVCSGAYVLAAAGLLNGRRATTHWGRSSHFARTFPRVKVDPDRIYTHDGKIWTSAGITAGIDLALALVGDDLGQRVAKRVAQELVVYHRRPGGQSQFSALLDMEQAEGRFTPLVAWMREHVAEPLPVERLAQRAGMSPRNFARAFSAETGLTPAKAIERLRLEVAREKIEAGTASIERIAVATGFRDPERMRRAFVRSFGQPPQAMRRMARAQ